jgi:hypothetical protein
MKQVERVPDLRSQNYERLRIAIRGGEYAPGTRLLEDDVSKDLDVWRTSARVALALLTQDGLSVHEGPRFKVPVYDDQKIIDVFEIRQRLEPYAVRLACERATSTESVKCWKKLITAVTPRKAGTAEEAMSHQLDLAQQLMLAAIAQHGNGWAAAPAAEAAD